jgi:hypothetical protein
MFCYGLSIPLIIIMVKFIILLIAFCHINVNVDLTWSEMICSAIFNGTS